MKNSEVSNEYVSKKEFKKSIKNLNLMILALCACVMYMWFCK